MSRGNHWRTERRIKASLANPSSNNNNNEGPPRSRFGLLSDELMDDSSSSAAERPGAYAITANRILEEEGMDDNWDPTDQTAAFGASLRDESSSSAFSSRQRARDAAPGTGGGDYDDHDIEDLVDLNNTAPGSSSRTSIKAGVNSKADGESSRTRKWCTEWKWLIAVGVVALLAIIGVVVMFVLMATGENDNNGNNNGSTSGDALNDDPCDFTGLLTTSQPDPFLQCECHGEISVLTEGVRKQYDSLIRFNLLANHLNGLLDKSSCAAPNVALVWSAVEMSVWDERGTILKFESVLNRFILANFYATTGGHSEWDRKANWLTFENSECVWFGVDCNTEGQIISLSLPGNGLMGHIDTRIGLLTALKTINLSVNQLEGSIPLQLWSLPLLEEISLDENECYGQLPTSDEQIISPTLQRLSLRGNPVSGPFPNLSGLTNLEVLDLSKTLLSGPFSSFSGLTSLREIALSGTINAEHTLQDDDWNDLGQVERFEMENLPKLKGSLPSSLVSMTSLKTFSIRFASVGGTLPDTIGDLVALEHLVISDASLAGSLPSSLGELTNLVIMDFARNQISGQIPPSIGNLTRLTVFSIENSDLTGTLPTEINKLQELERLFLTSCPSLSGTLPIAAENLIQAGIADTQISIPDGICNNKDPPLVIFTNLLDCPCCVLQLKTRR